MRWIGTARALAPQQVASAAAAAMLAGMSVQEEERGQNEAKSGRCIALCHSAWCRAQLSPVCVAEWQSAEINRRLVYCQTEECHLMYRQLPRVVRPVGEGLLLLVALLLLRGWQQEGQPLGAHHASAHAIATIQAV